MTKTPTPAARPAEERTPAPYDALQPHPAIAALGAFADAVAVAVKFPNTPVPPAITDRIDQAVANLKAAFAGEPPMVAQVSEFDGAEGEPGSPSVFERLERLEAFAERTSESLPTEFQRVSGQIGEVEKSIKDFVSAPSDLAETLSGLRSQIGECEKTVKGFVSAPADLAETLSDLRGRLDKVEKPKPAAASAAG